MRATPADVDTISAETFRIRLAKLGLPKCRFASRTGMGYSTVKAWGAWRTESGTLQFRTFPPWVDLLLAAWEAHGVPDAPRPRVGILVGSSPPRKAPAAPQRPAACVLIAPRDIAVVVPTVKIAPRRPGVFSMIGGRIL
jgi:hypothetical protein